MYRNPMHGPQLPYPPEHIGSLLHFATYRQRHREIILQQGVRAAQTLREPLWKQSVSFTDVRTFTTYSARVGCSCKHPPRRYSRPSDTPRICPKPGPGSDARSLPLVCPSKPTLPPRTNDPATCKINEWRGFATFLATYLCAPDSFVCVNRLCACSKVST